MERHVVIARAMRVLASLACVRHLTGLVVGVVFVGATIVVATGPAVGRSRYDELKKVINRNTGYAHMTRGANVYTVIAPRECARDDDLPAPEGYPLTERERRSIRGCALKPG